MIKTAFTSTRHFNQASRALFGRRTGTVALALCGVLATLTAGCDVFMQKPLCQELPACGAEQDQNGQLKVIGDWILADKTTSSSCSEDLYVPPSDTRLVKGGDVPPKLIPPPEQALFDWCLLLVTSGGANIQAVQPRFSVESPHVGAASVRIKADGEYTVGTSRTGTFILDFPTFCVRAFGAKDPPPPSAANPNPPANICKVLEVPVGESGLGEGAYRNTTCDPNPQDPGGCTCKFDVSAAGGSAGSYQIINYNTLRHLPNTNFPQYTKFCQRGDRLQLTGANGSYLFDQVGLRTLDLVRAPPDPPAM